MIRNRRLRPFRQAAEPFAYLVCGTWSLLGTEMASRCSRRRRWSCEFSNEGGVGGTYQLLKNIMGLWILQECKREWDEAGQCDLVIAELVELARAGEPFRSLIHPDDPRFYLAFGHDRTKSGILRGNGSAGSADQKGEIVRCILESLALRYRQALEQAEKLTGTRFGGLHMVGGGIQNRVLCRFTADALGRPVWAGPVEASAIGNMLMQLVSRLEIARICWQARKLVSGFLPGLNYEPAQMRMLNEATLLA